MKVQWIVLPSEASAIAVQLSLINLFILLLLIKAFEAPRQIFIDKWDWPYGPNTIKKSNHDERFKEWYKKLQLKTPPPSGRPPKKVKKSAQKTGKKIKFNDDKLIHEFEN